LYLFWLFFCFLPNYSFLSIMLPPTFCLVMFIHCSLSLSPLLYRHHETLGQELLKGTHNQRPLRHKTQRCHLCICVCVYVYLCSLCFYCSFCIFVMFVYVDIFVFVLSFYLWSFICLSLFLSYNIIITLITHLPLTLS
jgi:hypothetical protein